MQGGQVRGPGRLLAVQFQIHPTIEVAGIEHIRKASPKPDTGHFFRGIPQVRGTDVTLERRLSMKTDTSTLNQRCPGAGKKRPGTPWATP